MPREKQPIEYVSCVPQSIAYAMIEEPLRIESPDGWGAFIPTKESFMADDRHINITGEMKNETNTHEAQLFIVMPGFAKRALAKFLGKEPQANVNVQYR
jgi:hypothetical protein